VPRLPFIVPLANLPADFDSNLGVTFLAFVGDILADLWGILPVDPFRVFPLFLVRHFQSLRDRLHGANTGRFCLGCVLTRWLRSLVKRKPRSGEPSGADAARLRSDDPQEAAPNQATIWLTDCKPAGQERKSPAEAGLSFYLQAEARRYGDAIPAPPAAPAGRD
jgi:hypothetical protein